MVELLKQPQYEPMHVIDQVLSIFAGAKGHLDDVPLDEVREWERSFLAYIHEHHSDLWDALDEAKDMTDDLASQTKAAIKDFKSRRQAQADQAGTAA